LGKELLSVLLNLLIYLQLQTFLFSLTILNVTAKENWTQPCFW